MVNSCLTLAIVAGMSVSDLSQKAIANLGWDKIKLTAPVFAGDTIYAESEVLEMRDSRSRPTQGIVTVSTTGKKADGTVFMSYERTILVPPPRPCGGRLGRLLIVRETLQPLEDGGQRDSHPRERGPLP